jgi:hypothetical protein
VRSYTLYLFFRSARKIEIAARKPHLARCSQIQATRCSRKLTLCRRCSRTGATWQLGYYPSVGGLLRAVSTVPVRPIPPIPPFHHPPSPVVGNSRHHCLSGEFIAFDITLRHIGMSRTSNESCSRIIRHCPRGFASASLTVLTALPAAVRAALAQEVVYGSRRDFPHSKGGFRLSPSRGHGRLDGLDGLEGLERRVGQTGQTGQTGMGIWGGVHPASDEKRVACSDRW